MILNANFKENNAELKANFGEVAVVGGGETVQNPLEYATYTSMLFNTATFPDNYELTLNLPNVVDINNCIRDATGIKKITIKGNTSNSLVNFNYAFSSPSIEIVDLTEFNANISDIRYCFYNSKALKEIKGVLNLANATKEIGLYTFSNCNSLEEIRFAEETIKTSTRFNVSANLSAESIQSIIDGLATVETAQTLTLHSTVHSALTDEQLTMIFNKNWSVE